MMKCIIDTNVFNHMLDGDVDMNSFEEEIVFVATHVQRDEISKTSNNAQRVALQEFYSEVVEASIPTETAILGISRLGNAKLSNGMSYNEIKSQLDERNNSKSNNIQDALIADTARKNGYTLVTHDSDLREVSEKLGIECISVKELRIDS